MNSPVHRASLQAQAAQPGDSPASGLISPLDCGLPPVQGLDMILTPMNRELTAEEREMRLQYRSRGLEKMKKSDLYQMCQLYRACAALRQSSDTDLVAPVTPRPDVTCTRKVWDQHIASWKQAMDKFVQHEQQLTGSSPKAII